MLALALQWCYLAYMYRSRLHAHLTVSNGVLICHRPVGIFEFLDWKEGDQLGAELVPPSLCRADVRVCAHARQSRFEMKRVETVRGWWVADE